MSEADRKRRRRARNSKSRQLAEKAGDVVSDFVLEQLAGEHPHIGELTVFKDEAGNWRWVMLSSNAFEDRDKEIVSQKALEADVKRADEDGEYGPVRWWHVPGIQLGECDFNAMHGRVLVESGTFKSAELGEAFAEHVDELGISIGFLYREDDLVDGIYRSIKRFERSILPREAAANLFTRVIVEKEASEMLKTKIDKLKDLIGEKLADGVLDTAAATEKAALEAGVKFKEGEIPPPAAEPPAAAPPAEIPAPEAAKEVDLTARVQAVSSAVAVLNPPVGNGPWTWAENVFDDHVIITRDSQAWSVPYTWDDAAKTATLAAVDQWTEVERVWQPKTSATPPASTEAASTSTEATKANDVPPPAESAPADEAEPTVGDLTLEQLGEILVKAMRAVMATQAEKEAGVLAKVKELETAIAAKMAELDGLKTSIAALQASDTQLSEAVKALIGEAPRNVTKGLRASQSESTLLSNQPAEVKERVKSDNAVPAPDPLAPFLGAIKSAGGVDPGFVLPQAQPAQT